MFSKVASLFQSNKDQSSIRKIENHSLYLFNTCPFCLRVLITIKKLGINIETRNIHQGTQHRDDLQKGGGSTMVPCLRIEKDDETQWMYESADIVRYLEQNFS